MNASEGRYDNGNNTRMPDVDDIEEEGGREKGEVSVIPKIVCICFIQLYSHSLLFCYHGIKTNKKESMLDAEPRAELENADHHSSLIEDDDDTGAAEALAEEEEPTKALARRQARILPFYCKAF